MPKRTTEFQKLVLLMKRHVAAGATVTESKMMKDLVSGKEREVDVVIEASISGHPIYVSIECTETHRAADIGWVERMKSKHDRLPTNALVLASKAGLTSDALALAQSYGIQVLSFATFDANAAESLFGETGKLWSKTFTLQLSKVVITVSTAGGEENVSVFPDNLVYTDDGKEVGPVKELVEPILRSRIVGEEFGRQGDVHHDLFELLWDVAASHNHRLYLKSLVPDELRAIVRMKLSGHCSFEVGEFRLRKGIVDNVKVAWGQGKFDSKDTLLVASEDSQGNRVITLTADGIPGSRTGQRKVRTKRQTRRGRRSTSDGANPDG